MTTKSSVANSQVLIRNRLPMLQSCCRTRCEEVFFHSALLILATGLSIGLQGSVLAQETVEQSAMEQVTGGQRIGSLLEKTNHATEASKTIDGAAANGLLGERSGLWQWTDRRPHHDAVVSVATPGGAGTGVVIYVDSEKELAGGHEGYVLTAWHVVQDAIHTRETKVRFCNGRSSKKCQVIAYDESADVAVIWAWIPAEIPATPLATAKVESDSTLELAGLGGGAKVRDRIRTFSAIASKACSEEKVFADVSLLSGDSGGPIFNAQGEVVGVISGGWFWWDSGLKNKDGRTI